jgi:hypothetical protein
MNQGREVSEIKGVTLSEAILLLENLRKSGQVFRVDFIKKSNGAARTMVCRFGVGKYTTGGGRKYNPLEKGLLGVYEFGVGYRSIPLDSIIIIKSGGIVYDFVELSVASQNAHGKGYEVPSTLLRGKRTLRAKTSPLYN